MGLCRSGSFPGMGREGSERRDEGRGVMIKRRGMEREREEHEGKESETRFVSPYLEIRRSDVRGEGQLGGVDRLLLVLGVHVDPHRGSTLKGHGVGTHANLGGGWL